MANLIFIMFIIIAILIAIIADRKKSKFLLLLSVLVFSLLSGLRGINVGIDTSLYNYAFTHNFPYSWQFEETGFRFISLFLMNIFNDTRYVFFFYSFIINFFIIFRLWDFREKSSLPIMLLFYSLTSYIDTMNIMRQFVAISIIFYSTKLLENKKYIFFMIVVLCMTFIHSSSLLALVYIPIYMWNSSSSTKKVLISIPLILLCCISLTFVLNFESGNISNYLSAKNSISNINITFVYRFLIFLLSYLLMRSNKFITFKKGTRPSNTENMNEVYDKKYRNITFIYFVGLILCSIGMFYTVMARLGYYYIIFEFVYWGFLFKKSNNRWINFSMFFVYALYVFLLEFFTGGSGVLPFSFNL